MITNRSIYINIYSSTG